ncbi:MAG: thioredoxin domain-containing protein [Cytophagales bacterium]|nr:thioredoxin domain-containing protein [Cytophagales bacterium]
MNGIPEGKNRLYNATSPYLLQHADNPVDWYPWGEEALQRAKTEDKPILLSIGYSSCHWCHVMAHESFEDTAVARVMNENFINIKLDREERPDIDQIYMDAVQAMGQNGGWPLNVFITPDQKPFFGGTYFPTDRWMDILEAVTKAFTENRDKLNQSAEELANIISASETDKYELVEDENAISRDDIDNGYLRLAANFDPRWGGMKKEPKFPMPSLWQWLLSYGQLSENSEATEHLLFTLDKIAAGGIYDQIGGGFARYSVDDEWHVPHFEKMLYDNGQLLSLYANAYKIEARSQYLEVMEETMGWLEREMLDKSGGFYAALDADSDGEEGKFYVWSMEEIEEIAGDQAELIKAYYDVQPKGNWEHTNVLRRLNSNEEIIAQFNIDQAQLKSVLDKFKADALKERAKRIRPGLDSKLISGWNALTLSGLTEVYIATGSPKAQTLAQNLAQFMMNELIVDGKLLHTSNQQIQGFLEDYAALIQSFIRYYEGFQDEKFLQMAKQLTDKVIEEFYDEEEGLFYYTSSSAESLIARKKDVFDNVIPSSNSIMSENLYKLSVIFDDEKLRDIHQNVTNKVKGLIKTELEYTSNWALTSTAKLSKQLEIVVIGADHQAYAMELQKTFRPNQVTMAANEATELPLMEYKTTREGETTIYVCSEKVCRRPVTSIEDAEREIATLLNR